MRADQTRGCRNQIGVVSRRRSIRQLRDVFQSGADAVSSLEPTSIDCPTCYAVPVVDLLQRDPGGRHNVFHLAGALNGRVRIGVERLDEDAATAACQAGTHERSRIFNAQQSSLDTDASREQ